MATWQLILVTARVLGVVANLTCAALWMALIARPHAQVMGAPSVNHTVPTLLAGLAVIGVVTAAYGKSISSLATATVSFVPAGFYLLHAPSPFAWIGWLNIAAAFAAVFMGWAQAALYLQREKRPTMR